MKVFISYSHRDKKYIDDFKRHSKSVSGIEFWDDSHISPGQNWLAEINAALAVCQVAILFVSADFLASDFIMQQELPVLIEKNRKEQIHLLVVILRPCLFDLNKDISVIQAMNPPDHTVSDMLDSEREFFWVKLSKEVIKHNIY